MQDWQQRVIDEKAQLDERITKLKRFITGSTMFANLSSVDRVLLSRQLCIMNEYSSVLKERITNFKGDS